MKIITCIGDPVVIEKILAHLNITTASVKPSPLHKSRALPKTVLFDAP